MLTAPITNIQRFSLNDGPGIRSTVFFQGCNMHCAWCHNPETISMKPVLLHYANKCIGCGKCIEVCPNGAHKIMAGQHIIDRTLCTRCGKCAETCFVSALVMSSREMTVEEVMFEIRQDKLYYEESGGGVTFSGGECVLHSDFIIEVAKQCRAEGIPVAVETNMYHVWSKLEPVLSQMDLIMCDFKHMECVPHHHWTGIDNQLIINNIGRASLLGIPMIVRTPLIPGATDDVSNIHSIAEYIARMKNIHCYELLNYNPLGASKRVAMGVGDAFANCTPLPNTVLDDLKKHLSDVDIILKIS